jgi:hypothetical protein
VFTSGFSEGISDVKGSTNKNVNEKRVVSTEVGFDILHNILHYFYTNQITFHSKPGKEPVTGPRTVDVQSIYEIADRFLLPHLKDKALYFLGGSCDIQNITGRMFGEYARTHEHLDLVYRAFFRTHLPLIVQTIEFNNFFEQLEGSDADQINARFRKVVQESLRGKKLVASRQSITSTCIETEDEDDDDDDDSTDLDYEPDDDQNQDEEMEDEGRDDEEEDEEEEDDNEGTEIESSEESSDEEE